MKRGLLLLLLALAIWPGLAPAQPLVQRSFSTQLFEPALASEPLLAVESAALPDHLAFAVGAVFNYQHLPLQISALSGERTRELDVVERQLTANFLGILGLRHRWLRAQLGVDLPVNLYLQGTDVTETGVPGEQFSAAGLGDLRLQLKVLLLEQWRGFSAAFSPILTVPTSCLAAGEPCDEQGDFGGDPDFSFRPRVVVDYRYRELLVALNLGYLVRRDSAAFASRMGDRLVYGVGAGYQVHPRVQLLAELDGQAGFGGDACRTIGTGAEVCEDPASTNLDAFPLEALGGVRVHLGKDLYASLAAGAGIIRGIGAPQLRVLAGLRWSPDFADPDGDGVYGRFDECPNQPEDHDGFRDHDGCPDVDNDNDMILDVYDKCPDEAEDRDGFQDDDGCPDLDNDGDGIPDAKDHCPFEPENFNGIEDEDGCPDFPDADGDKIPDDRDNCPREPEDHDGFQDQDGCPDPDNDGDGIPDSVDQCPLEPEDKDGYQDEDGCPDLDHDLDGVPDRKDRCPKAKETINGYRDHDGCPDEGAPNVLVAGDRLELKKPITFLQGQLKLTRQDRWLLDQVALTLLATPQVKGVRVGVYSEPGGSDEVAQLLADQRAKVVRQALIAQGLAAARVEAVGYSTRRGRDGTALVELLLLDYRPGQQPAQ